MVCPKPLAAAMCPLPLIQYGTIARARRCGARLSGSSGRGFLAERLRHLSLSGIFRSRGVVTPAQIGGVMRGARAPRSCGVRFEGGSRGADGSGALQTTTAGLVHREIRLRYDEFRRMRSCTQETSGARHRSSFRSLLIESSSAVSPTKDLAYECKRMHHHPNFRSASLLERS